MLTERLNAVIVLLLAAVMLLSFAACVTPNEDEPLNTAEAAAPTDEPEVTGSPEATEAPESTEKTEAAEAAAPSEAPLGRDATDEELAELAWSVAEEVTALYGGTVSRESAVVEHDEDGVVGVVFHREKDDFRHEHISVAFDYEEGWKIVWINYHANKWEVDDYDLAHSEIGEMAGKYYTYNVAASDEDEAVLAAMQLFADMLKGLPEGNHARCSEAAPYRVLSVNSDTREALYGNYIAVLPDDYFTFNFLLGGFSGGLCPAEGELYLHYLLGVFVLVEGVNADGAYRVRIRIPYEYD